MFNGPNSNVMIIIFSGAGFVFLILLLCLCYFCIVKMKRDSEINKMKTELATLRLQSMVASQSSPNTDAVAQMHSLNYLNQMNSMPNQNNAVVNHNIGHHNAMSMPNYGNNGYNNDYNNGYNNNNAQYYGGYMDTGAYNSAVLGEGDGDNNPGNNNNVAAPAQQLPPAPEINEQEIDDTSGQYVDEYNENNDQIYQKEMYDDVRDALDDGYQETGGY